jgi:DnaK suppressor protein
MDKKQEEMKGILVTLREETLAEISRTVKNDVEKTGGEPSGDIYDQASSERDRELLLLLGDRERDKVRQIDEALLKLEDGEYGICEECEEEIPLGRLRVLPFARLCVKCKADMERLQAQTKRFEEDRAYRDIGLNEEEEA